MLAMRVASGEAAKVLREVQIASQEAGFADAKSLAQGAGSLLEEKVEWRAKNGPAVRRKADAERDSKLELHAAAHNGSVRARAVLSELNDADAALGKEIKELDGKIQRALQRAQQERPAPAPAPEPAPTEPEAE